MSRLPLAGIKVLDMSRVLAGPFSATVLGDLGARVIKLERPGTGDDTRDFGARIGETETTYYYAFNRNKKSAIADLRTEEGRSLARRLAAEADVLIENSRPGGMEKFGLGFESLREMNPGLIYCAITGYDIAGEEAGRPGYDIVAQGECGLMAINGDAGNPPLKFGIAAVDMFTGMYAAQAILAALFERQSTGRGRRIDLALHDCGTTIASYSGNEAMLKGMDPPRYGNDHPSVVPYGVFEAKDGPIVLAVGTTRQFAAVCTHALGRPDIAEDPRFQTNLDRSRHRDVLVPVLNSEFQKHERRELLTRLERAGVPCGEVLTLSEALAHPRSAEIRHRHEHPVAGPVDFLGPPWRFDGERCPASAPPRLGENTEEVLRDGFR